MVENFETAVILEQLPCEILAAKWLTPLKLAMLTKDSKLQISELIYTSKFVRITKFTQAIEEINAQLNWALLGLRNMLQSCGDFLCVNWP